MSDDGWTVGKVIGLIVCLLGMVGFGVCGLCGIAISLQGIDGGGPGSGTAFILILSACGFAIATGCAFLIRSIFRSARRDPPQPPPLDP